MCQGTRSFEDKGRPTAALFGEEIKRERKSLAKPDPESALVAVGWTGDSAGAPGWVNPMGRFLLAPPDRVSTSGQPWDRDGARLCAAGDGFAPAPHTALVP